MSSKKPTTGNLKRAFGKIALVMAMITLLVIALSSFVSDHQLDQLKHSLDLWTIIALVVIINLVSFACFIILFFAYQWIRSDLKPQARDEFETNDE